LGARIRIVCDDLVMIREVDGGSSHASQNSSVVHFGLGQYQIVDSLTVTWPGGKSQSVIKPEINKLIEIEELYVEEPSILKKIINYFMQ
jgi:hypothetical protein